MTILQNTGMLSNAPTYVGVLFPETPTINPTLNLLGGIGGKRNLKSQNKEFATSVVYGTDVANQPEITEKDSLVAPPPKTSLKAQNTNVTQIFQDTISVSYEKLSSPYRLSGISGNYDNTVSEVDFQIGRMLERTGRNINYTILNGNYQISTDDNTADKTRGLLEAAGTKVSLGTTLSKDAMDQFFKEMFLNGATFENMYLVVNADTKIALSNMYSLVPGFNLPLDRNLGGLNISGVETDFGLMKIYIDRDMPVKTLLAYDLSYTKLVEQDTFGEDNVNKGNFFIEDLGKKGASVTKQLFGKMGVDYANPVMHGVMSNIL